MRSVFVVGPDKKIKLVLVYPMTTGRNFDEVLRVIDSLQLTANHKVATPAQWKQGDDVVIAGSVSNDAAKEIFGSWDEPKPYIRIVPQPQLTFVSLFVTCPTSSARARRTATTPTRCRGPARWGRRCWRATTSSRCARR